MKVLLPLPVPPLTPALRLWVCGSGRVGGVRRDRGFVLVVAMSLLVLVLVVSVGLLSLASVGLRGAQREEGRAVAMANARMAMMLALNQLQEQMGDDRRISARAELLESEGRLPEHPSWCGVWEAGGERSSGGKDPQEGFRTWLVTERGEIHDFAQVMSEVEGEGVALGKDSHGREVVAPVLRDAVGGGYGWWTEDEAQKARVDFGEADREELGFRMAGPYLPGKAVPEVLPGYESFVAVEKDGMVPSHQTISFLGPEVPKGDHRALTVWSESVLSNVRDGGLQKDLSALFELPEDKVQGFGIWEGPGSAESEEAYLYGEPGEAVGARWNQLYAYHRQYRSMYFENGEPKIRPPEPPIDWNLADSGTSFGDPEGGFRFPRLAKITYLFSYRSEVNSAATRPQDQYKLTLVTDVFVTLWNPFDVHLVFPENTAFYAKMSTSLPLRFDWRLNNVSRGKVGLEDMIPGGYLLMAPFVRSSQGSMFALSPGETVTFSLQSTGAMEFRPGMTFDGGISTDRLMPGGTLMYGAATDRISVGLIPADHQGGLVADGNQSTSQYLDFWLYDLGRRRPYYEHRGEIIAESGSPFGELCPELSPGQVPSVRFNQVVGRKQPFAAFTMECKTANDSVIPVSAFLSSGQARLSSRMTPDRGSFVHERLEYRVDPVTGLDSDLVQVTLPGHPNGADHGFIGSGRGPESGQTHVLSLSLPRVAPTSISQYRHAGLGDGAMTIRANYWGYRCTPRSPYADQAVGNSYAHPLVAAEKYRDGDRLDHRFLVNDALWDPWFLSSAGERHGGMFGRPESADALWKRFLAGEEKLVNPRFRPWLGGRDREVLEEELFDQGWRGDAYRKISGQVLLEGGFNVNSTSVEAWQAILSSGRKQAFQRLKMDGGTDPQEVEVSGTAFARGAIALTESVDHGGGEESHYSGFRDLSDEMIRKLAEEVVKQVKLRGPFRTRSAFVNRGLDPRAEIALSGALQSAIDASGINDMVRDAAMSTAEAPGGVTMAFPDAAALGTAAGNPGWLMQAEVLDRLGSVFTVRGDTFRVRAYGEARDKGGKILAKAVCEAVVQRVPGWVSGDDPAVAWPPNETINQRLGRRFEVVGFRWMHPAEIAMN